jgi:hypothetical protein
MAMPEMIPTALATWTFVILRSLSWMRGLATLLSATKKPTVSATPAPSAARS